MKKILLSIIAVLILGVGAVYYYVFIYSKNNHRDIQSEKSLVISSEMLVKEYEASDSIANTKFLNKALEIKGCLAEKGTNTIGQITLIMGDQDPFAKRVFITLNSKTPITQKVGDTIIVKGKCTGNLSDVVVTEAVIK
ncbi:MAG: hypothetical protein RLZ95_1276 [Bacteroidota bacterium]|jgi:hypothetical protein